MYKIGERVGAIMKADNERVWLFGYGIYDGDEVPPPGVGFMGLDLNELQYKNPKITLDNKEVVWGCECWWGSEEKIKSAIGGRMVIPMLPSVERKRYLPLGDTHGTG